jgi:hypothetical protein
MTLLVSHSLPYYITIMLKRYLKFLTWIDPLNHTFYCLIPIIPNEFIVHNAHSIIHYLNEAILQYQDSTVRPFITVGVDPRRINAFYVEVIQRSEFRINAN